MGQVATLRVMTGPTSKGAITAPQAAQIPIVTSFSTSSGSFTK